MLLYSTSFLNVTHSSDGNRGGRKKRCTQRRGCVYSTRQPAVDFLVFLNRRRKKSYLVEKNATCTSKNKFMSLKSLAWSMASLTFWHADDDTYDSSGTRYGMTVTIGRTNIYVFLFLAALHGTIERPPIFFL